MIGSWCRDTEIHWSGAALQDLATSASHGRDSTILSRRTLSDNVTASMPSLLVVVFALEVIVQIINNVGAATINNLVSSPQLLWAPDARTNSTNFSCGDCSRRSRRSYLAMRWNSASCRPST